MNQAVNPVGQSINFVFKAHHFSCAQVSKGTFNSGTLSVRMAGGDVLVKLAASETLN